MSDPIAAIALLQQQQFAAQAAAAAASHSHKQHQAVADIKLNHDEIAELDSDAEQNFHQNMFDQQPNNMNDNLIRHIISDESGSGSSDSEDSFAFDSGLARPVSKKSMVAATKKVVPVSAAKPLKKRGRRPSELPREVTVASASAADNARRVSIGTAVQEPVSPLAAPAMMQMQPMMQMQEPNILTHQVYFQQRLNALMAQSQASLKALQDYDKSQGLPASHCATMVKSYRSRKQLLTGKILKKWDGTPLISFETNADGSVTVRSGDKKERKKAVKKQPKVQVHQQQPVA